MLHAADDVVAALTEGYQLARRSLVRAQESARREFIDDLLDGRDRRGRPPAACRPVSVSTSPDRMPSATVRAERPFDDASPLLRTGTLDRRHEGRRRGLAREQGRPARRRVRRTGRGRSHAGRRPHRDDARVSPPASEAGSSGVGRPGVGADGVVTSHRESRDVLSWPNGSASTTPCSTDATCSSIACCCMTATLSTTSSRPRSGRCVRRAAARPPCSGRWRAYFGSRRQCRASARDLHLSVRATTYRLDRIARAHRPRPRRRRRTG